MPRSTRPGWINWRGSRSKAIVMRDLISGLLPVDADAMPARQAWELCYMHMIEFVEENVQFEQFKERLADHRKQMRDAIHRAKSDRQAFERHRSLFPRQERNHRGELVFDMHPAKKLLREDVLAGNHVGKTPSQLRAERDAYKEFPLPKFKERIYQEVAYQKFCNYLDEQREKKGWVGYL